MSIDREEARRRVEAAIAGINPDCPVTSGRFVETSRSWIFEWGAKSGEPMVGNVPMIVSKVDGGITVLRAANLEFQTELGLVDRVRRAWHRLFTY